MRALAEADDVRVGSGRSVDRGAEVARVDKARALTDFDDARAERRSAGFGAAGGDVEIRATIDDRAAGVIVRIEDENATSRIARDGRSGGVGGNRDADFEHLGGAGEDVVLTCEPKRTAGTDAVTVARTRGERAEELDTAPERVAKAVGAEGLLTVADGAHIERTGEGRDGNPQGTAEGRSHRRRREGATRRGEITVEREDTEIAEIAEDRDAGGAADAADTSQAEDRAGIDDDRAAAERRAGGRGDLDGAAREDVRSSGVGVGVAGDAQRARAGLGDRKGIGADGVLDDAREVEDGTTGAASARRDVEDRGVATGDRAHEADVLLVGRRRGREGRITEGQVTELVILFGETVAEDAVIVRTDAGRSTIDHDGDAAGGGALRADDGGEAGTEARHVKVQEAALELEGRRVRTQREGRIEINRTRTQDEAGLRVDVGDRVAGRVLAERKVGRAALDDLDRARAVEEIARESGVITTDHDQRARGGRGVGDDTRRAGERTDLDRAAVEVDRTRVVEDEVDRGRLGRAGAELDGAGLDGDVGGDPVRAAEQQGARAELREDVGRDRAGKGRGTAAVTAAGVDHAFTVKEAVVGGLAVVDEAEEDIRADDRRGGVGAIEEDTAEAERGASLRDDLEGATGDVGGGLQRVDGASPGNRLGGRDHTDVARKLSGEGRGGGRRGTGDESVRGVPRDEIRVTRQLAVRGADDDRREDAVVHRRSDRRTEDLASAIDDDTGALGRGRRAAEIGGRSDDEGALPATDEVLDRELRVKGARRGKGKRTASGEVQRPATQRGHQVGRGGIDLQGAAGDERTSVRAQGRRSAGIITDQQGALVDIPNRGGSIVDREVHRTGAVLIERARAARGDEGRRLACGDIDGAGGGGRQDDVDVRRVRGEAEHRDAGITVKIVGDRVIEDDRAETELAGVRDGDHAVGDGQTREVVRGGQHQGARADLLEAIRARPTQGTTLGEDAAFGDVHVAGRGEIKGLGQGDILLPHAQRTAVHADDGIGAEVGGRRDGDVTRRDHRDARIGIRTLQAEGARAELAEAVVGAVAIRDDAAERHHRA